MNVEGKLHLRVDAALNDELAGLSEDQARQVARSTMPVGSVMTVAGWLLLGGADGGPSGWVGSVGGRPVFRPAFSEAVIPLSASSGRWRESDRHSADLPSAQSGSTAAD